MKKLLYSALLAAFALMLSAGIFARNTKSEINRNIAIFTALYKELQLNYIDTVDPTTTMRTAIDAMLSRIDPYTEYYGPENQEEILSVSSGEYAGIGSTLQQRDSIIIIADPRWDSPARRAGLRHGDIILAVDDIAVTPSTKLSEVSSKLRGQPGTDVKVDVRRPYVADSLKTVVITRGTITIDPVPYYGYVGDGVGYIRVTTFNEKTASKFSRALRDLKADPRVSSLVIDLRDNGGGLLESAVQLVGNFVPKGTMVVETRGRDAKMHKVYKTTHAPVDTKIPLAVLINDGTASAAEILAGSLQDLDRAVIVGSQSYGKGLVQNIRPLPYDALMKITTGRYYIPSGRLIQAVVYKHDGSDGNLDGATRIPDSLTNVFHTAAGREVRDGGGIRPDSVIAQPEMNRLMYILLSQGYIDDYANRFANTHNFTPDSAWTLPDTVFSDFKAGIDRKAFKYDLPYDRGIDYLREAARIEGYLNDSITAQLDLLSNMLKPDLEHDLDMRRDEIFDELSAAVDNRYFSEGERLRRELGSDSELNVAKSILASPELYRNFLVPSKKVAPKPASGGKKSTKVSSDNQPADPRRK